jgi:hypothetical protein
MGSRWPCSPQPTPPKGVQLAAGLESNGTGPISWDVLFVISLSGTQQILNLLNHPESPTRLRIPVSLSNTKSNL